jgi:hypothetical protein
MACDSAPVEGVTMAEQKNRQSGDDVPNRASSMEPAEGSRETVESGSTHQQGAGITNRPLEQEQQEQESLPPRGQNKEGGHA